MASQILMKEAEGVPATLAPSSERGWSILGWFGLLLLLMGLGDIGSNLYQPSFGSAQWEFTTIAMVLGALPLVTIGLAALSASFVARGIRWGAVTLGVVLVVFGIAVALTYLVFLSDVPLALQSSAGRPAAVMIRRVVIRASILGLGFSVGYLAAAYVLLKSLKGRSRP